MNTLGLTDITKSFAHPRGQITVLNTLNASFNAGESVAIVGPSGSGKSTLLSLMAGLDRPDAGTIHWLDTDISI
jgi:putative ABC transport system ATP-binding protein